MPKNEINESEFINGFTKIPSELLIKLSQSRIKGEAIQFLHYIIRKTYGFHKKSDFISTSQISKETGLSYASIYKQRRFLKSKKILSISQKGDSNFLSYSINESYAQWEVSPKKESISQKGRRVSPKKVDGYLPKRSKGISQKGRAYYTKDTLTKDTITKDTSTKDKEIAQSHKNEANLLPVINHKFIKPTSTEVTEYCKENNYSVDGQTFVDFYESKGWLVGKSPMKNWQAAVRTWERKNKEIHQDKFKHNLDFKTEVY